MTVSIAIAGGKLAVSTPYHPDFPPRARDLGGDWNGSAWLFDQRDEERVRALCVDIYGTDGVSSETVTVRVPLDPWRISAQSFYLFGREIAFRPSRDARVRLGEGVTVVEGGFDSRGGSVKNPRLDPKDGTVLEIRDIPAGHKDLDDSDVTVIDRTVDVEALRAERERLAARLAEIDGQLG